MLDMKCILLVRGKIPTPDMITLARTNDIVLLSTMYKMYTTCGILYEKGWAQANITNNELHPR